MTIKVIGAGFGRTGTSSFKAALEILGFGPCYHMDDLIQHLDQVPNWEAARNGTLADWELILQGYNSTTDWPACNFYEVYMRAYPDAKVILTTRDPEKWYESVSTTIYRIDQQPTDGMDALMVRWLAFVTGLVWEDTFGGRFEDKAHALSVYNQHTENVKRNVPADKLLVFDVKDGWEPLCKFLGVPVPVDTPFPHLNDRQTILERFNLPPM
jgi:hypothetical protein